MTEKIEKKDIVKLIFGLIMFLLLGVGATYAYFKVNTSSGFQEISVSGGFQSLGSVSLHTNNKVLSMSLSNKDLMDKGVDTTYYASNSGATTTHTKEVMGVFSSLGNDYYNCSYTLTLTPNSNDNIYTAFQSMVAKSADQIVLKINGETYDFNTENLFPITYNGIIKSVKEGNDKYIKSEFYLVNKTNYDQSGISGKTINMDIAVSNFNCEVAEPTGKGTILEGESNLSTTPLGDLLGDNSLYRYQGNYDEVDNNYICFGTSDRQTCIDNPDTYMYRILGVSTDHKLKLIKNMVLTTGHQWHNTNSDTDWAHSTLYNDLNSTYFLTNTDYIPTGWSNKILNVDWKYGDADYNVRTGYNALTAYNIEKNYNNTPINAKVGLMYVYDYFYANNWDGNQKLVNNNRYNSNGWIHIKNLHKNVSEFLLSRYGIFESVYRSWFINTNGNIENTAWITGKLAIRPVFYTNDDITDGDGTATNPYMFESPE